ncbi:unnamed protein product [Ambrosiozyma monospora]|uniref:Unnamed protein product n=1 Tax=Ambrosiozyma monospora TaxID=43982 RepID=A0A9W6YWG9_AMBMO|nr:unnamed protein product [Ambrosiozyma monospora]
MSYSDDDEYDDLDELLDEFDDEILSKPPGSTLKNTANDQQQQSQQHKDITNPITPSKSSDTRPQTSATTKGSEEAPVDEQELLKQLLSDLSNNDPELSANLNSFIKDLTGNSDLETPNTGTGSTATSSNDIPNPTTSNNANKHGANGTGKPANFQDLISDTVNRIKSSGEQIDQNLKDESQDDELLSTLLKSLDLDLGAGSNGGDGGSSNTEDLSKLLVEMLDKLSSKDVLFEPLNDLYLKYPGWLTTHKTDPDFEKYTKQYDVIKLIVDKFNDASYSDSNVEDKEFVNVKLEELQELGMPPKEIANDDLSFLNYKDGKGDMQLGDDDIPPEIGKELEETCKQA